MWCLQVWISLAQFEMSVTSGESDADVSDGTNVRRCRDVYAEANRKLKESEEKEERLMLLESWREFELEHGDAQSLQDVDKLMPNKVKKRRKIQTDDGVSHPYSFIMRSSQNAPVFSSAHLVMFACFDWL